jgi:hypothetical protein
MRRFVPHYAEGVVVISEKRISSGGLERFCCVARITKAGRFEIYDPTLTEADQQQCRTLVSQLAELSALFGKATLAQPLVLAAAMAGRPTLPMIRLLQGLCDYASSAIIYNDTVADYLAQTPDRRFSPNLSTDLYRQAFERHDLARGLRLIDEDLPVIRRRRLSRHDRECVFDAFYHIAQRAGKPEQAFQHLRQAWAARQTDDRCRILVSLSVHLRRSADVIHFIDALSSRTGAISSVDLARSVVARWRLGQREQALHALNSLKERPDAESRILTAKVTAFLTANGHDGE